MKTQYNAVSKFRALAAAMGLAVLTAASQAAYMLTHHITIEDISVSNILLYERGATASSLTWAFSASDGPNALVNPFLSDFEVLSSSFIGTVNDGDADPSNDRLVVAMNAVAAGNAIGEDFFDVFGYSEASILTAVQTFDTGTLFNFFDDNASKLTPAGDIGRNGVFTRGDLNGTYQLEQINTVPEPATMAVLGLGVLALKRKRRA